MKPNCEICEYPLPYESTEAMICSYECTYCRKCVQEILKMECPNCGGNLEPRPLRKENPSSPKRRLIKNKAS